MPRRINRKNTKKPPQSSRNKTTGKRKAPVRKRKKAGVSDAIHAALLTGILICVAALISTVYIMIKSSQSARLSQIESVEREKDVPLPAHPITDKLPGDSDIRPVPEPSVQPPAQQTPQTQTPPRQTPQPVQPPAQQVPQTQTPQPVQPPAQQTPQTQTPPPVQPAVQQVPHAQTPKTEKTRPPHRGTLVFIIDDAGNNLNELEPFLRFPGPLTIAVLPGLPHSAEAARRIRAAGKEVFLHQPMEALGGQPPGPGAIYSEMSDGEIRALLNRNIKEIGPIAGINNHQGSKITMNPRIMETVLIFCREQGLYFLDSRTTSETQAPAAAKQLGMKIGQRNIFIDNEPDKKSMNRYINDGLVYAHQNGSAVLIGHTWSEKLGPLLLELYPGLAEQGYTLSIASRHIADK